jgi:hypothetical protein
MNSRRRVNSNVMPFSIQSKYGRAWIAALCVLTISTATLAQTDANRSCASLVTRNAVHPKEYFPKKVFDDFTVEWYSKALSAMREPSLGPRPGCSQEIYLFLWLRSFHAPIAVRVWSTNGRRFLVAKQLSGKGGYEPGRIVVDRLKPLSDDEWNNLTNLLTQVSFWDLPTEEPTVPNPDGSVNVGSDGAQWIIEGLRGGNYHVTDRWSAKAKYREVCLYLLKLSDLRVKKTEIY